MKFEPLYYADRLTILNPEGDVGICTLWTPVKTALGILGRLGIDMDPSTSRIAVVANLYGDGLPQMIRNLLWSPQIRHLVVFGQDLSGSEDKLFDELFKGEFHDKFKHLIIHSLGNPSTPVTLLDIRRIFKNIPPKLKFAPPRINAPLPKYEPVTYPSDPSGHTIIARHPIDAWEDVVCRVMRFGVPNSKGKLELLNLKVVINEPTSEADCDLKKYGFSRNEMTVYQNSWYNDDLDDETDYTYGNRLAGTLDRVIDRLNENKYDRGCYITLWFNDFDLTDDEIQSHPCMVSLYFRLFEGKLTLSATFRVHNVMSAWLKNVYGLMSVRHRVARNVDIPPGAITVTSHSISIDPSATERYALAEQILAVKRDDMDVDRATGKRSLKEDPNGYFVFEIAGGEIVATLKKDGAALQTYQGKTAREIEAQIARDSAISLVSHALYVGRTLKTMEDKLKGEAR